MICFVFACECDKTKTNKKTFIKLEDTKFIYPLSFLSHVFVTNHMNCALELSYLPHELCFELSYLVTFFLLHAV